MSLVDTMKSDPFSLAVDGSNDSRLQKMNPLTVRILDFNRSKVATQLLDMCLTSASTAESIFMKINETLLSFGINWNNYCVSFSVDNRNVNIKRRNSIKTRVHQQNPSVCPCHMVHNTASKAADAFEGETGFDVEDMLVDLYYWFNKSTKRKSIQYREIVKHISVCWLSLECAVERTLRQYAALKSYFMLSDERQPRFLCLKELFSKPIVEVYLLFYQAVMPMFTIINKFLQRETPCVHLNHDVLKSFVRKVIWEVY